MGIDDKLHPYAIIVLWLNSYRSLYITKSRLDYAFNDNICEKYNCLEINSLMKMQNSMEFLTVFFTLNMHMVKSRDHIRGLIKSRI